MNQNMLKLIVFTSKYKQDLYNDLSITSGGTVVDCSSQVKDLGVISLRQHVSYTSKTCRFHHRNISRIRKYIPHDISVVLIKSLVMSRLDYSNGLLYGLPKCTVSGLQAVVVVVCPLQPSSSVNSGCPGPESSILISSRWACPISSQVTDH